MSVYNINGGKMNAKTFFPVLSMFKSIGIIGDSFASGEIYIGSLQDYYANSWGQVMGRACGIKVYNYSQGGLTTKQWLENWNYGMKRMNEEPENDLYLIALGINDANQFGTAKLGTIADITSDSTDSFYSYYGRIVRAIKEKAPNAMAILSTLVRFNGIYDTYSNAIKEIGDYYDLPVIDVSASDYFKSDFYTRNMVSNHPTAINYSGMAYEYSMLIEEILEKNITDYASYVSNSAVGYGDNNCISPDELGAVGNGVSNDTVAIQKSLDNGGLILFGADKNYKVTDTLRLKKNTILDLNGSTITSTNKHLFFNFQSADTFTAYGGNGNITIRNGTIAGGAISFAHGENIRLENVTFKNSLNDHFLEIAGCKNYVIEGCRFIGMANVSSSVQEYINIDPCTYVAFPWLPDGSAFYDGAKNDGISIDGCYFALGEGTYAFGFNAFGVHGIAGQSAKHKNVRLTNNKLIGFTGCGFRINDMKNVFILNNEINVEGDGIRVGDVGQSINVLIKGNVITASGTAITKENSSTIFQSADNDINPTFS